MSRFQFTAEQRVTLYAAALPAFIAKGLEHLPPRGKQDPTAQTILTGKLLPGRFDQCAAAWAQSTVDSLEYRIGSDIEYHEKKAREKGGAT